MSNNEAHIELSKMLSSAINKRDSAPTKTERDKFDKPIEALRHACKVLRNNLDQAETEQTTLF